MTYEEWREKVNALNKHINGLKEWNGYAQDCQIEYDRLVSQRPIKEKIDDDI